METGESQNQTAYSQQPEVSFPQPREPQKKGGNAKIVFAVIGVILILVAGGYLILGSSSGNNSSASPTPDGGLATFPTPTVTQSPEASPSPTASPAAVDKTKLKIEVLNGTGVPGEASFLKGKLEELDFKDIDAGNADSQNATETVATYSRELSPAVVDEITAMLEEVYETVRTRRSTQAGDYDVSITTGPRKKSTSSSPTATARATASPTATP